MIRIIVGDHSYCTHHTHQQVFQTFGLDHPLDMLLALASSQQQRLSRRALDLLPTDFLHRVDWTSITGTLQLIACIRASVTEVPIDLDAAAPVLTQARHLCPHCDFATTSLPNMRRHLTTTHGLRQYRTSHVPPAYMSQHGAPQCKNRFQVLQHGIAFIFMFNVIAARTWTQQ